MNVHDSSGGIDSAKFLDYIVNQFPGDLKTMIEARDELASRQGAMSAVQLALADRDAAAKELANAKDQADALVLDAKSHNAKAKARNAALDTREATLDSREKLIGDELTARDSAVMIREAQVAAAEVRLAEFDKSLQAKAAAIEADRATLDARVKAFQDKVATLTA